MKTSSTLRLFFILLFSSCLQSSVLAQSAAQTVTDAANSINQKIDEMHQLAERKKVYAAIEKLDEVNKEINKEVTWGTFDEKYKEAKLQNPGFTFSIRGDLPAQLEPSFWADYESRCDRIMANRKEATDGIVAMVQLNAWDKVMAYGSQLKTMYETFTGAAENLGTANLPKFAYDLYGNMNDFIDNYKKIEQAELEGLEIENFKAQLNLMVSKAKKSQELYNEYKRYIKSNRMVIDDFKANIKYINKLKGDASSGPLAKLSYADNKYNWNYGPFQKEVKDATYEFTIYEIKCPDFKKNYEQIIQRARINWTQVQENIFSSDDAEKKGEFLKYHDDRWTEFLGVVNPIFNKTYDENCMGKPEAKNETPQPKKETEVVVADDPFEGSSSTADAEPSEEPEEKKTEPEQKKKPPENETKTIPTGNTNYTSSDKYWENTIPANAEKEWIKQYRDEYQVRFKINGRTVGYRGYKDPNFSFPKYEEARNNIAIKHGPYRLFSYTKDSKEICLSKLSFFRANKKTGPEVYFEKDGSIRQVKYFIDDFEVSEAEYRQKENSTGSLAPFDIYKQSKWKEIPTETNIPDPPEISNSDGIAYHQIKIPVNAIKYITSSYTKGDGFSPAGIHYAEFYYLPNNTFEEAGERYWFISGNQTLLVSEKILFGGKILERRWSKKNGDLLSASFRRIEGVTYKEISVGPNLYKGNITYYDYLGKKCTLSEYASSRAKHPELPDPDIISTLSAKPNVAPFQHPDPLWVNQDVTTITKKQGAEIWRISISGRVSIQYDYNHSIVYEQNWHDKQMSQPSYKSVRSDGKSILLVSWFTNGQPKSVSVKGRINRSLASVSVDFNEDGSIKSKVIYGQKGSSIEYGKIAYQDLPNIPEEESYLSPYLKNGMSPPQIPQAEITPMFTAIWGKENGTSIPANDVLVQKNDPPSIPDEKKTNPEEDTNYEQLQQEEFFRLSAPISKKMDEATAAFDKPYWEESQGPRATDNPKQESLDLLKQAAQIAKQAKYPENEGALDYFIAFKAISFSGRVFDYKSKQEFFLLAAQLVNASDQLITRNGYLKQELSEAYCNSAEIWREMTRKALWGDHAYNKMECDKMVIRQYELAVQADPNNLKAKKILEQLKAPKKPVPAQVLQFDEIPDEVWNKAHTRSEQLEQEILGEKIEENYLEVADMTLDISKGTVSIKRSGAENWQKITESVIPVFPFDRIKTSDDAEGVSITYTSDKTFLAIKPGSEVLVEDDQLMISRGGACLRVVKDGNKFLVITPTCAVGVRGTEFEVDVAADKTTRTYLYEGVVETRNGTDVSYLVPGQMVTATKNEDKFQQADFNVSARKASSEWIDLDAEKRKYDQAKAKTPVVIPSKNHSPNNNPHQGGNSHPSGGNSSAKYSSPSDVWSIQTYSNDLQNFKQQVTANTNNGFVPVGINCSANQFELLYLGGGILTITEWNMEWYPDANNLQQGITNNMNAGFIPTGFSWSGSQYYVFYVKTDFTGQAWQIVPAPQDLREVSNAIQPWLEQNYTPMGITLFGDEYYTLLVQFVEPLAAKWQIEGYQDNSWEISNGINSKIPEGIVPWGMLKSSGVANILYIGY